MAAIEPKIILTTLEERVEQLISEHRKLTKQNKALSSEREQLLGQRRDLQQRVKDLEKNLALMELGDGLSRATRSNKRARNYINRLMREVDSCIKLVSAIDLAKEQGAKPDDEQSRQNGNFDEQALQNEGL